MRRISTNDGLPQSFVSGLAQDDNGFIWIATRNGLARYDGREFKILQHRFNDSNSLASSIINWIKKDANGNLWIEYESGEFDILDINTNRVTHFITNDPHDYAVKTIRRGWLPSSDGSFWFIPRWGGVANYKSSQLVDKYNSSLHGFPSDTIKALLEDSRKNICVLSQRGISRFNKTLKKFSHFQIPYKMDFATYSGGEEEMVALHERGNGELMWIDSQNIYFFNPVSRSFRKSKLPAELAAQVRWISSGPDGKEYFEAAGTIFSYNEKDGALLVNTIADKKHGAKSFLVDRSGLLWIGTNADGVYQFDVSPGFASNRYMDGFAEDLLKKQLNIDIHEIFNWENGDEGFLSAGYLMRSAYDKNNNLWIALKKTVCRYDRKTKAYVKLPEVPFSKGQWMFIKGITINGEGEPVVISERGEIFTYSSRTQKWVTLPEHALFSKSFGQSVQPQDMFFENGRLWVTTSDNGLFNLDRSKKIYHLQRENYPGVLPSNQLLGIVHDPVKENILWIGTYQGLIRLDTQTLKSKILTTFDGLPDNTIYSMVGDSNGFLWLSTNKGICRIHSQTFKMRNFSVSHGLQGNEFNRFHHLKLPDGRIAFGGTEGWSLFNPISLKDDDFNPNVVITEIKINNALIKKEPYAKILPNSIKQLDLKYTENTLQITFAGMQYNQPEDLIYRYKLEGYDTDWVYPGHRGEAVYTKLPPGHYIFKVNASNTSGRWSSIIKTFEVIVQPPWWMTWWAYGAYAILAALAVWFYISYRVRQGILRQEMLLKEKETNHLKEMDEMKSRFFANITHELRTPLTLILSPLERLKNTSDKQVRNRLIITIKKNAGQLLDLTNQMLDLAKLEARAVKPQLIRGNPAMVLESVTDAFTEEALNGNITLKCIKPENGNEYWLAMEMLERIVYNLLSNALKFTPAGGRVELELQEKHNGITIIVKDTGIGIPADMLPYIFDRFYRVSEEAGSHTGTGIGLSLVKELVEVQGGTITVRSYMEGTSGNHATGTIFSAFLPYNKIENTTQIVNGSEALAEPVDESLPLLLLVEDNADLAKFIIDSLGLQCRIIHSGDGESGLAAAQEMLPDLIISDVLMPGKNGFELCSALKGDYRTSHIPVILLTAKAGFDSKMTGLSCGADDYITKPFHVDELNMKISNQLNLQKKLHEHIRKSLHVPDPLPGPVVVSEDKVLLDSFLNEVYALIEKNIDDPTFKVEELAEALNMSRTSLHRRIKSVTTMTTGEVINAYRLKKAAALLPENYTIAEVAFKTGFATPAYFSKCFRELYNITPTAYIKKVKLPINQQADYDENT